MKGVREAALAIALTACAGPSAGGQVEPVANDPRARLHLYEVAPEQVAQSAQEAFIEVSGTGSVDVSPDRVSVSFAMETRATTAAEASSANAEAMDAVLSAIRGGDFDGLELSTHGYSLRPEYAPVNNNQRTRRIIAYVVMNNVRAVTSDVEATGRVIDLAIGAGANRVGGISFFASDTEDAKREAMTLAVQSARADAEAMATALGHRLGAPIEVRGGAQRPSPVYMEMDLAMSGRAAAQAVPTPIEAGDQTVTATVTVRFALGPELGD